MIDLAVVNGRVASPATESPDRLRRANVLVDNGKIVSIQDSSVPVSAKTVLDADGMLVLPGAIDVHFHCREPSYPQRGDFATESRAAAAGGVTSIFEMPIAKPCASTVDVWRHRRDLAAAKAYVNIGLYGAPGLKDRTETHAMADAGAIAFKLFTTRTVAGREDEFLGLATSGLHDIVEALEIVAETGLRCVFHAEDQNLIDLYASRARLDRGPAHLRHNLSRPALVEAVAIAGLVTVAQEIGTPIHIAHVSSRMAVETIRTAKRAGAPVTAETCPHYLFCTEDDLERAGPFGIINPPLRTSEDRDALWEAIADGTIDLVATDHAPYAAAEKEAAKVDMTKAPPGHPGIEYIVPLLLGAALRERLSLGRAVELVSTVPARLFGLYPERGVLWPGAEADITVYDPRPLTILKRGEGFSEASACNVLYDGMEVQGKVHATVVAGVLVYQAGEIVGTEGVGVILKPRRGHVSETQNMEVKHGI